VACHLSIAWKRQALKDLRALPPATQKRIQNALHRLVTEGYGDVALVRGVEARVYRLRVGDWRVFFTYEVATAVHAGGETQRRLVVARIAHRREAYGKS